MTGRTSDSLILIGVYNVLPLAAWRWFCAPTIRKLQELTGAAVRVFTYVREGLDYECVFREEVEELRKRFEAMRSSEQQAAYVTWISDDFDRSYPRVAHAVTALEELRSPALSEKELAVAITSITNQWTDITPHVWYAALLDLWYPRPDEHAVVKQIAARVRDRAGRLQERSVASERRLWNEAAQRIALDVTSVQYLFPAEVSGALANGASYVEEAQRRQRFCVTVTENGDYKIYSGPRAEELFQRYRPPSIGTDAQSDLRGTPASAGKARGSARVIRRDAEFDTFRDGEVLVTLQTMVQYLPIMKRASAILTEFGGLTSHAAIVARELGKPCIVGVHNLLASVHNGDTVEVDADKGVVRVVKRS